MPHSLASIPTKSASRYMQQLSKHWGHHGEAVFDAERSRIDFGKEGVVTMQASSDTLHIDVECDDDKLKGFADAVEEHIKRFAFREQLDFAWSKAE